MTSLRHKRFGITHPTWIEPTCFNYDNAEDAADAILRVYGADSSHLVVEAVTTDPRATAREAGGESDG